MLMFEEMSALILHYLDIAHLKTVYLRLRRWTSFTSQGTEKVILIQEQLSKNRVIIDLNSKGQIEASVTSSTHERRSQTRVSSRKGALVIKMNFLTLVTQFFIGRLYFPWMG